MASLLSSLASLAAAGTMLVSASVEYAAPHQDVDGLLFLVNREWRISENFVPEVEEADVPGQVKRMRQDAASALAAMFAACKEELGVTLVSVSGYRSYDKQQAIYSRKLGSVGTKERADEYVARPGASEHQLGLAMDVGQRNSRSELTASFGKTKGGAWIRENCWKYGFILRYDEGWEDVTGYNYEPWHVRYVGIDNAKWIHEKNLPLETCLKDLREQRLLDIVIGE